MDEMKNTRKDRLSEEDMDAVTGGSLAEQSGSENNTGNNAFDGKNEPGNNGDIYTSHKKISIL